MHSNYSVYFSANLKQISAYQLQINSWHGQTTETKKATVTVAF